MSTVEQLAAHLPGKIVAGIAGDAGPGQTPDRDSGPVL